MKWIYDDGGRSKYFKGSNVGDCVTRSIAIATGIDYKEIYDRLKELCKQSKKYSSQASKLVRQGTPMPIVKKYLEEELGWKWVSTIDTQTKARMHLVESEIPNGVFIARLSKHLVCVKDKVIYDTYNSSEKTYYDFFDNLVTNNERCVYGYWKQPTQDEIEEQKIMEKNKELEKQFKEKAKQEMKKVKDNYNKKIKDLEKQRDKKLKEITKKYANQLQEALLNMSN